MDLQLAQLSDGCVAFLTQTMPSLREGASMDGGGAENGAVGPLLDYERWLDEAFQPV